MGATAPVSTTQATRASYMTKLLPYRRWNYLGYRPNQWSLEHVHKCEARFGAYVTCRQCGKTVTAAYEIDLQMEAPPDSIYGAPHVGVLGPTYDKAELSVNKYINLVRDKFGSDYVRVNLNKHQLSIPATGARLTWMSADVPETTQGHTFSALVVDEAQNVADNVWELVYPTLSVRRGIVRAFGTPDITPDQTWFKSLYWLGQDPDDADYHSFTLSAYDNVWMAIDEIEQAKRTLPDRTFRMLYLGEWVDIGGSVFQNIDRATIDKPAPPVSDGIRYIIACDLAMREDYNVVLVAERASRTVVHLSRWNKSDLIHTYDRIYDIWDKYGRPTILADATGMGDAIVYELREHGIRNVRGVKFTSANKMEMIGRLQGAIEHRRIMFHDFKPLISELKGYVYKQSPSGKLTAEASSGMHDDCVSALLLLNEGLRGTYGAGESYKYIGGNGTETLHDKVRKRAGKWKKLMSA